MCTAVQGDARDHLSSSRALEQNGSYGEVKADLLATFGQQESENLSKLTALRRLPTTPLDEYVASFRKLRNLAAISGQRDDLQVWLFLKGLGPERLRTACMTNGPRTL